MKQLLKIAAAAIVFTASSFSLADVSDSKEAVMTPVEAQTLDPQVGQYVPVGYICRNGPYFCTLNLSGMLPIGTPCTCYLPNMVFHGWVSAN